MTKKYTLGPWSIDTNLHVYGIAEPLPIEGFNGATITDYPHVCKVNNYADARLISCAPELLEALEELVDDDEFMYTFGEGAHIRFKSLINKAKGETP